MNIGIFANYLLFERAGVGKYSLNLIQNLIKIDPQNRSRHFYLYFSFWREQKPRKELIRELLGKLPANAELKFLSWPAAWLERLFATSAPVTKIIREPLDLWFSPYVAGIPQNGFPKMVTTCHDLVFLRFPAHRGRKLSQYYLKRHQIAVRNCQKIIVPSQATKKDLEKFLDVPAKKIAVIYEAAEERFKIITDKNNLTKVIGRYLPHSFKPTTKYILSVGTLEPRKNLIKLVEAYSILPHQLQRQYQLVLVGAQGWNNEQLQKTIINLNLKEKVLLPGFVKDEDLPYIYNGASIFVYPSLYEGFGLPPLEAMACGLPVISSNLSSLPEVIGKAGILLDPQNEIAIAAAIKRLIFHPKLAKKIAKQAQIRAKNFSWPLAAHKTLEVFESI